MLPKITHKQFIVLRLLNRGGEFSGTAIKSLLEHYGATQSQPGFYLFIGRMKKDQLIIERKEKVFKEGRYSCRKSLYCISSYGRTQFDFTKYFYQHEQWIKETK